MKGTKKIHGLEEYFYTDVLKDINSKKTFDIFKKAVDSQLPGCATYYQVIEKPMYFEKIIVNKLYKSYIFIAIFKY